MEINKENLEFLQSACNPVAVANTFAEWCTAELHRTNSMNQIKDNELLLGLLGKLCSLFHLDHDGDRAYKYLKNE